VHGRPFDLKEILGETFIDDILEPSTDVPQWVLSGELQSDTLYYGIGKSTDSQEAADNDARLSFAQHVEVSVQSIAIQQIEENRDRLEENYSYESLVSTNMALRSVKISARYVSDDSTFYSLIRYGKATYHRLVTQEVQISLEANIRKQELEHQAKEALRADSLRHKITMDSLDLARKQAVIDSLDHILKMDEARLRQEQNRLDLIKSRHAAFLKIKPHHILIDIPSAKTPNTWFQASGRWDYDKNNIRQLSLGASLWLITLEADTWGTSSMANQADISVRLEVLPSQGDLYPVQLSLGYISYISNWNEDGSFNLTRPGELLGLSDQKVEIWQKSDDQGKSFLVVGSVGIPQFNTHVSAYLDKRKFSLASIWYPFPRNMGDAISIINQFDFFQDDNYKNRWGDSFQWQFGLRLIAISDRFATMISYEDHEIWMLNFEFQY
jgi:hypothetical protein